MPVQLEWTELAMPLGRPSHQLRPAWQRMPARERMRDDAMRPSAARPVIAQRLLSDRPIRSDFPERGPSHSKSMSRAACLGARGVVA